MTKRNSDLNRAKAAKKDIERNGELLRLYDRIVIRRRK